jgi:hypothetical protein
MRRSRSQREAGAQRDDAEEIDEETSSIKCASCVPPVKGRWPLILGDIMALVAVSWGCYSLHTRIESAIAKLEEL